MSFNQFLGGLQAGQAMRQRRDLAGAQEQALNAQQAQAAQVTNARQGALQAAQGGNFDQAAVIAGAGGDADYAELLAGLGASEREQAAQRVQEMGRIAAAIQTLPDEKQRAQAILMYGRDFGLDDAELQQAAQNPDMALTRFAASVRDVEAMMAQSIPEVRTEGDHLYTIRTGAGGQADIQRGPEIQNTPETPAAVLTDQYYAQNPDAFARAQALKTAGRSTTTINTGDNAPEIGTIPQGYQVTRDESGQPMMAAIPGGPADPGSEMYASKARNSRSMMNRTTNTTVSAIDRALDLAGPFSTGAGSLLSVVPGTVANDLQQELQTIRANVAFNRLNEMRAASPTGGALGQVTERELDLLAAVEGALDPSQTPRQFIANMRRVRDNLVSVQQEREASFQSQFGGGEQDAPAAPEQQPQRFVFDGQNLVTR